MSGLVLIFAPRDDAHALAVRRRLQNIGFEGLIADTLTFPTASTVSWRTDDTGSFSASIRVSAPLPLGVSDDFDPLTSTGGCIDVEMDEILSIWFRRARRISVHSDLVEAEFKAHAIRQGRAPLSALFRTCETHNRPGVERSVNIKPYQLYVASQLGVPIPRTLVTSDESEARDFVTGLRKAGEEVIYKETASTSDGPPTRAFRDEDFERLGSVRYFPVTFQQRIKGGVDVRILVIGREIFGAAWRPAESIADDVDIRLHSSATMWPMELPASLRRNVLELHKAFGLSTGVYDFKMDADGVAHFLEVNPSGQWLDLEVEAGYPVSAAMARFLVGRDPADVRTGEPLFCADDLRELIRASEPERAQ